jgi:RNA polymerase sigma factor (TIGR02999 family)
MGDVTHNLEKTRQGDRQAAEELLPLVYEELRKLAASKMAHEEPGQTLQPTALVHEAWLKLVRDRDKPWDNRGHFFAAAAEAMRRILIDRARSKRALRHGGDQQRIELQEGDLVSVPEDDKLLALNDALEKFATENQPEAELVKLRYFGGLEIAEAADVLGISVATANRYWAYARAWLYEEIRSDQGCQGSQP